jgi:hypothetical protein
MKYNYFLGLRITILLLILHSSVLAQVSHHYTCYRTQGKILADGLLTEADWVQAEWSSAFTDITGDPKKKPEFLTRVKLLWDDSTLYVAAELREPHIWGSIKKRDAVIFHDNDFEVFLDPAGDGQNYLELEINALNTLWDLLLTKSYKEGGKPVTDWNLRGVRTGVKVYGTLNDPADVDSCWTVEMALPLAGLTEGKPVKAKPADGVQWRMNFSRVEWKCLVKGRKYVKKTDPVSGKPLPEDNWVWAPMGEVSMHIPSRWGWLEFSSEPVEAPPLSFSNEKQRKEFGIWFWGGGHESWKERQWDSLFSVLEKRGVKGIITQASPAALKSMITLAHRHGVRVEKWFVAMMTNDRELLKDHPDWFVINKNGISSVDSPAYVGYYRFLCPSNPEVREYLQKKIAEYLDIPGLDGISLDYIRYPDVILPSALWEKYGIVQDREYPQYDYCYCNTCRERFKLVSGLDPMELDEPWNNERWLKFRYNQVTSLVSEITGATHARGKKLSAAVFPGPGIAKKIVRQDWGNWPLDEVMPMLYHSFYYGSLDWIRAQTAEGVSALSGSAPLYSGLYLPSLTPRELQSAVRKSMEGGASGICIFTLEGMTAAHWTALEVIMQEK